MRLLDPAPAHAIDSVHTEVAAAPQAAALAVSAPMREFLTWVDHEPRTYAHAMTAWRSSCPRFTVWEDALDAGLVQVERGNGGLAEARVVLTPLGRAALVAG